MSLNPSSFRLALRVGKQRNYLGNFVSGGALFERQVWYSPAESIRQVGYDVNCTVDTLTRVTRAGQPLELQ